MLVLAVGGPGATASDRIVETLIGGAVGVLVSLIAPPQVRQRSAGQGMARLGVDLARLVDRSASGLVNGVSVDEVERWLSSARRLSRTAAELDGEVAEAEQSRRLNPRALGPPRHVGNPARRARRAGTLHRRDAQRLPVGGRRGA